MTIAELIEEAAKRHGHSWSAAARAIGTTNATLRAWRRGQIPKFEWAARLGRYAEVDEAEVVSIMVSDLVAAGATRPYINSLIGALAAA